MTELLYTKRSVPNRVLLRNSSPCLSISALDNYYALAPTLRTRTRGRAGVWSRSAATRSCPTHPPRSDTVARESWSRSGCALPTRMDSCERLESFWSGHVTDTPDRRQWVVSTPIGSFMWRIDHREAVGGKYDNVPVYNNS